MRPFTLLALVVAGACAVSASAGAAKRKSVPRWQPAPVVKDCTRFNGRFGYYGNPWCSKAEQEAWDRASSRRLR